MCGDTTTELGGFDLLGQFCLLFLLSFMEVTEFFALQFIIIKPALDKAPESGKKEVKKVYI